MATKNKDDKDRSIRLTYMPFRVINVLPKAKEAYIMRIETVSSDRKAMAKAIAEYSGKELRYMGPPSFAYAVGPYLIDRDGVITSETEEENAEFRAFLEENGFAEPTIEYLNINLPIEDMDGVQLKNLVFMLHSKQYLLNKATGRAGVAVSEGLVAALQDNLPTTKDEFLSLFWANLGETRGISFSDTAVILIFPLSNEPECSKAYTELAAAMLAKAKEAKRVSPAEQKPENEKYYFRIWLIQLGLGGKDSKDTRKVLMQKLVGHSAFRTDEEAEKFKADQKAKRAAAKAAKAEVEED